MTREEAISVLNMVEAYGLADQAKQRAIEALKNERPKGRWLDRDGKPTKNQYSVYCSECTDWSEYASDFCMNCGADMRGV